MYKSGVEVDAEEVFGTIEAVKTVSDLFMPVKGVILEVNKKLDRRPELINTDPYGDGWIIKISVTDTNAADGLLSSADYEKFIGH